MWREACEQATTALLLDQWQERQQSGILRHIVSVRLAIVLLPGALDAAFALAGDILAAANRIVAAAGRAPRFTVTTVALGGRTVVSGLGRRVRCDGCLPALDDADVILLPGQNNIDGDLVLAGLATRGASTLRERLAAAHRRGAVIAAACTGVFYVAHAGLLAGRTATTAWFLAPAFRRAFPDVTLAVERSLVCEGKVWTAGAALSIVDLTLALVRHHCGVRVASTVVRYLALETHPSQARFFLGTQFASSSREASRAESFARAHVGEQVRVADLARAAQTSERTLARRLRRQTGSSPGELVRKVRVEEAVHLLETTDLAVEEVAARVGLDATTLRRQLKRSLALSPREVRKRAGGAG